ncbi:MAG: hypothetical protein N2112_01640 [Gemmataceae bacterium]|jgi:hypothetical protein|nr:hypothetical protein [Gemmataceae bacterium]
MAKTNDPVLDSLLNTAMTGLDEGGSTQLKKFLPDAAEELQPAAQRFLAAEDDDAPAVLAELLFLGFFHRRQSATIGYKGNLEVVPTEDVRWESKMPAEPLYLLVPETRAFAKKVKPEAQVETIETHVRLGDAADLRLLQIYLKHLEDKKADNPVADIVAKDAIPAFGKQVLPDLWPTLGPDNRTFTAASKIDIQSTLKRLSSKTDRKTRGSLGGVASEKTSDVTKAVLKLLEDAGPIGPEAMPMLKAALRVAEPALKRRIAETFLQMGEAGKEAIPNLIDAFEGAGFTKDFNLIRPMVVLGKDSPEVAQALARALDDKDMTVRLLAAFNIGLLGEPARDILTPLETAAMNEVDPKTRNQIHKTLNKLRVRFGLVPPEYNESA